VTGAALYPHSAKNHVMSSNPAPRQEGWIERTLYSLSGYIGCLGYSLLASFALTLLPAIFVAWNVEAEASWWEAWMRQALLFSPCLFLAPFWIFIKRSRAEAWQWRNAGYPEIEVQIHWLGEDEISEQPRDESTIFDTLLRFIDFPSGTFPRSRRF
jgi:hypothetical protein